MSIYRQKQITKAENREKKAIIWFGLLLITAMLLIMAYNSMIADALYGV